jgi:hypothetical protein
MLSAIVALTQKSYHFDEPRVNLGCLAQRVLRMYRFMGANPANEGL